MSYNKTIAIIGCGWLGKPLAESLIKNGFHIIGSTTSSEKLDLLKNLGIEAHLLDLSPEKLAEANFKPFLGADRLILTLPPKGRKLPQGLADRYLSQIKTTIAAFENSQLKRVFFTSSTSVYVDHNCLVNETETKTSNSGSGKVLVEAESLLMDHPQWETVVFRLSGLVGPKRHPGRFLAGRTGIKHGDAPVNLIHLNDILAIFYKAIDQNIEAGIYNLCADLHPTKKAFYTKAANDLGLIPPQFQAKESEELSYKVIDNSKIKASLNYQFSFPDPLQFTY